MFSKVGCIHLKTEYMPSKFSPLNTCNSFIKKWPATTGKMSFPRFNKGKYHKKRAAHHSSVSGDRGGRPYSFPLT